MCAILPPQAAKTAYPGAPVLAEWRVGFSFLVYTITKKGLAESLSRKT